jgi:hypothetical protein
MSKENIPIKELSTEDLEKILADRKKAERQKRLEQRAAYEQKRDILVSQLVHRASVLNREMRDFKEYAMTALSEFKTEANEYGDIRSTSKGGFSLRASGTQELVSLDRNAVPEYDERAAMALELIREFLEDKIKKSSVTTYRTVQALMERNKMGDLIPSRVAALLKVRDNYDDPRWVKAMTLFEESFRIREISYSVSFFKKDNMGKDKPVVLSFASIPIEFDDNENKEA